MKAAVRRILMLSAMLSPQALYALGLGDIKLNSALNQPFDAEIELVAATPDDLSTLRATLASGDTFTRYGLDRPAFLSDFGFQVARSGSRDVLRVTSTKPVTEPFVTLLVEANWPRGRLLREYTVLLDPPIFAPGPATAEAPVETPRSAASASPAATESYAAPAVPAPVASRPRSTYTPRATIEPGSTYQVQPNDTLWRIASSAHPGSRSDVNRTMLAIYESNTTAFDGNINVLRAGATLRIPEDSDVAAISASAAAAEVSRQYRAWQEGSGAGTSDAGHLRLVTPEQGSASASTTPPSSTTAGGDLQSRVQQLESELAEARRLLEVKNAELATLQAQTGGTPATAAPTEPSPAPEATPPGTTTPAGTETAPVAEEPPPAVEPPPQAAKPKPKPAPEPEPESGGILSLLGQYWWALLGLIVALGGVFYLLRKRRDEGGGESLEEAFARRDSGDLRAKPIVVGRPREREADILVEEKRPIDVGVARTSNLGAAAPVAAAAAPAAAKVPEPTRKPVSIDDTMSGELAPNLEAGDPLAEADFHMAYGLYDQAADLVQLAIKREPDRRDLRLKLLEIYFVWGNRDRFVEVAREMNATRASAEPGEWDKVVIMGKQIAPEDALFSTAVAGAGDLDLDLQDAGAEMDIDFPGSATSSGLPDIDLTGSHPGVTDGLGLDFVLDEPQRGRGERESSSQTTIESLAPTVESLAPTVESLSPAAAALAPTIESAALKSRSGPAKSRSSSDSTQEVDLESLGLDVELPGELEDGDKSDDLSPTINRLGQEDTIEQSIKTRRPPGTEDTIEQSIKTRRPPLQEDTIEQAIKRSAPKAAPVENEDDIASMTNIMRGGTGQMPAFELPDDTPIVIDSSESTGEMPVIETTRIQPAPDLGAVDFSLGEEAATMSEVGTKLDLARAYIDMGDPEGARSILEEVLQEGNATQKQEAERLMSSLP
jgi:pilus assembly protein FimV